jgi:hypothetical protein
VTAILPENLEEATVESMAIGETAWTTPWGMWVDRQRRCWLNPEYTIRDEPAGTVQMRVERHQAGVRVWVPATERWKLSRRPPHNGGEEVNYLPVTEIHIRPHSPAPEPLAAEPLRVPDWGRNASSTTQSAPQGPVWRRIWPRRNR